MKLPLSLIQSFLPPLDFPPVKIGEILTLLGIELDRIAHPQPSFAGVVVGEIRELKKHPDAKHLVIAQVHDGDTTYSVVCADPKCRSKMKVAWAKVGAVLTDKDGMQRRIEKTQIRGIDSFGMLCSGSELQVNSQVDQILELPPDAQLGQDAAALLWDPVFELSLTPNLGHAMSALGVARELSAALQLPLERPEFIIPEKKLSKEIFVRDASLCPSYMCCLIQGITVGPSPFWLSQQLEACGQKSINNVVDITNYIMMKVGQPLHAFDADKLQAKALEVGVLDAQEPLLCLDGTERIIPKGSLVIREGKKPIAIAGIIGGMGTKVTEETTNVLLEAALFDAMSIRSTSRKMALRTESSQRFEKGIDPIGVEQALFEATELLGGKCMGWVDIAPGNFEPKEMRYRESFINQILGIQLSLSEIMEIFKRLGFAPTREVVSIPLYRSDINAEIDLVEEVARIYGYNHIEKRTPQCTISDIPTDPMFRYENELRIKLSGMGLYEFLSCDLMSPRLRDLSREITPEAMHFIQARHAKTEEYSILRTSLLPGLLEIVKKNLAQKNQDLAAFEIGRIHFAQNDQPIELPNLALLLTGKKNPVHWGQKSVDFDFFDLKGIVENLGSFTFTPSGHMSFHPKRQADIHAMDVTLGSIGEVHPAFLEKFDIDQRVFFAELNLSSLFQQEKKTRLVIKPLPQFPASERDWTLPLPLDYAIDRVLQEMQSPLLERVELIDLYIPESLNQKNATFRFIYRDLLKTISFEEVEHEHAKIISTITKLLAK